jgi:peptidyl-prolyl cis-trans isomerase SurA
MNRAPASLLDRGAELLAMLIFVIGMLAGPKPAAAQELSIKVLVNDDPISDYDIDQRTRFLAVTTQQQPSPELRKKATDQLIDERLQMQAGQKLGITPDEDDVKKILDGMAEQNHLTIDGLKSALARAGINIKTLKDRIAAQLVWQDAVRHKFRNDVTIGDVDVDKALSDAGGDTGSGSADTKLQLRQVKFTVPSGANQQAIASRLAAAESLRAKFSSCANISDLAKGINGATVKTLQDQLMTGLPQPARLLVMNAKVGQMTPPTFSNAGIALYAVCGKVSVKSDTEVRKKMERKLMNQEMMIRAERLLRDLRQDAFIEYR